MVIFIEVSGTTVCVKSRQAEKMRHPCLLFSNRNVIYKLKAVSHSTYVNAMNKIARDNDQLNF